jgi:predicted secreted Zn-dependent protease
MTQTMKKLLAAVTLVATATSAHATVQADSSMKYYDVVGTTSAAIVASINSLGPLIDGKRSWAKTNWQVNVNYYYRADNDGCRVTSVTTTLNTEITMPQLVTKVSGQTRKWFDESMKKLLDHELGHRNIALGTAEDVDAAYIKMRAATCKELTDGAQEVFDEWIKRGNESQTNYDVVTKRGLKQQAWPTAVVDKKPVGDSAPTRLFFPGSLPSSRLPGDRVQ